MFTNYSGTFAAAIAMFVVPLAVKYGFSEGCANEIVDIGVPAVVAFVLMAARYMKGGVTVAGKRI